MLLALAAAGWVYVWNRISRSVHDAEYAVAFSAFSWHGTDYARVSQEELQDHFSQARTPKGIAGEQLDEIAFPTSRGTENCTLYAAGYPDGVDGVYPLTVLHTGAGWFAYEVTGFESLGSSPSASAVCGAFGLTDAGMIESVTIKDAAEIWGRKAAEEKAEKNNLGLWAPNVCSEKVAEEPKETSPNTTPTSECVIKGNINSKGVKIYHVPGQQYYDETVITPSKGERYFCTEQEAIDAGWRKSKV